MLTVRSSRSLGEYPHTVAGRTIMTVNPGFYGSPFLPKVLGKITQLRKMNPDLDIEVDGGITPKTIGMVNEAGANLFVSGSYLVKSDNMQNRINSLNRRIQDVP